MAERGGHGYELVERLKPLGYEWAGKPGPTYGELRKLEEDGMVASTWDAAERGPARRVYELTDGGRAALRAAAADMAALGALAEDYGRRYAALPSAPAAPPPPRDRARWTGGRSRR